MPPPNAASRCWKPHFRRLSNDLISEMAISESLCREIRQNVKQSVGCCKRNDFRNTRNWCDRPSLRYARVMADNVSAAIALLTEFGFL
jgi:hypothetical protein